MAIGLADIGDVEVMKKRMATETNVNTHDARRILLDSDLCSNEIKEKLFIETFQ